MTGEGLATADVMRDELGQVAFSAYVDAAQAEGHVHKRLVAGSFAAARAVVAALITSGDIRPVLQWEAAHGTYSGYTGGCRCEFCSEAASVYYKAVRHWKKEQGHNKVRKESADV